MTTRLPDQLESNARVKVSKAGAVQGVRREVDLTSNDGTVTITATDDHLNEKVTVDLSVPGAVGGPGGPPSGAAGGVLDGTYPNPGLAATVAGAGLSETSDVLSVNANRGLDVTADNVGITDIIAAGTYGSEYKVPQITVNTRGQVTSVVEKTIAAGTPIGSTYERASVGIDGVVAGGGHDFDFTGDDFFENTGGYDLLGTSSTDGNNTLQVLASGVYAITFSMQIDPAGFDDATFCGYTLKGPDTGTLQPSNDFTGVLQGLYPFLNGSLTYTFPANGSFSFYINHDASSSLTFNVYFDIQKLV